MNKLVIVCATVERPDDFVSTIIERPKIFAAHARIRNLKPDQILDYKAVFGDADTATVEITIRYPPDAKIDIGHWIYRKAAPETLKIWYKVRSIEDIGEVQRFLALRCSIDTVKDARTDPVIQRSPPQWEDPTEDPSWTQDL